MKNKFLLLVISVLIGTVLITGCMKEKSIDANIIVESIQTHEYFADKPDNNKYYINSLDELNRFGEIYSDVLKEYKDKLGENSLFVYVSEENSGSNELKLKEVSFDNKKVNFIISEDRPEVGTADMAFWYLIAVIPNEKLKSLDLSDWKKPSMFIK